MPSDLFEPLESRLVLSISLTPAGDFGTVARPSDVVAGDFNEDGIPDLAVGSDDYGGIGIHLGNGDGTFTHDSTHPSSNRIQAIAVGDLDNDGHLDVVFGGFSGVTAVLFGVGDGTFSPEQAIAPIDGADVEIADMNGDGRLDVVATEFDQDGGVYVILNTGSRTFASPTRAGPSLAFPIYVGVGDIDGDGAADVAASPLLLAGQDLPQQVPLYVLRNSGGGFRILDDLYDGYLAGTRDPIIADLNNDGVTDIAYVSHNGSRLGVQLRSGPRGGALFTYELESPPVTLHVADMDNDGDLDLVPGFEGGTSRVLLNDGTGAFTTTVDYPTGDLASWGVAIADFDADGDLDLATVNVTRHSVSVLLNSVGGSGGGSVQPPLVVDPGGPSDNPLPPVEPDPGTPEFLIPPIDVPSDTPPVPKTGSNVPRVSEALDPIERSVTVTMADNGSAVAYERAQDTGSWTAINLSDATLAPTIMSDLVCWYDARTRLYHAAGSSPDGLILFTRATDGTWTHRNLTLETSGEVSHTTPTYFASNDGDASLGVLSETGELLLFEQDGDAWAFTNVSSEHLAAQGLKTPSFEGGLVGYVTSWDARNIGGLDRDGNVHVVWIAPGMERWRTDDLSAITGAPRMTGALSVYLTPWGGINLAGSRVDGRITVTWWVPGFGGEWLTSNLTEQFGGPSVRPASLATFVTDWGGLNIAGLTAGGEVVVYWWAPGMDAWSVAPISASVGNWELRPDGPLSAGSAPTGELSIVGRDYLGDVLRYSWSPGDDAWGFENLTEIVSV